MKNFESLSRSQLVLAYRKNLQAATRLENRIERDRPHRQGFGLSLLAILEAEADEIVRALNLLRPSPDKLHSRCGR